MSDNSEFEIRRDADGDPIVTGVSVTKGGFWNDEYAEKLIQEEL